MLTRRSFPIIGYWCFFVLCLWIGSSTNLLQPLPVSGQTLPLPKCPNNRVLLVVVSARNLEPGDKALLDYLTQQGLQVEVKTGKAVAAADAAGKALVIVSETVLSDDVNNKFRDVAVPLITWEGWLYDNLRMTGTKVNQNYGELEPETQVRIVDPTHPLAAGLAGDVQLLDNTSTAAERKFHWGIPNANAAIIATARKDNSYAHLFAYEQGAEMVGLVAPARRVGFPNGSTHRFTTEGWRLFGAAVAWAMICSDSPTATPPVATATDSAPTVTATLVDPLATPTPTFLATTLPGTPTITPVATHGATPTPTQKPPPGATPTAMPTTVEAQLVVSKMDFLYVDADQNDRVSAGDTLLYTIKISNLGGKSAYQLRLVDPPDPNSTLLVGSVTTDSGAVVKGNSAGDAHVVIENAELPGGARMLVSLQARVNASGNPVTLQNQAITTYVDQIPEPRAQLTVVSDDPDTPSGPDTTITVMNAPLAQLNRKLYIPILAKS